MLMIKKQSGWKFNTSVSGGASVEVVVALGAGGGAIVLQSPQDTATTFYYASLGVGVGVGGKLGISSSSEENWSAGRLYILQTFHGDELQASDIAGVCSSIEVSADIMVGGSASALMLGYSLNGMPDELHTDLAQVMTPSLDPRVQLQGLGKLAVDLTPHQKWIENYAKAILIYAGANMTLGAPARRGVAVGFGVMGTLGYLWEAAVKSSVANVDLSSDPLQDVKMRSSSSAQDGDSQFFQALFDPNKFDIKPMADQVLQQAGQAIRSFSGPKRVLIYGYTDNTETQALSQKRATAVKEWLVRRQYLKEADVDTAEGRGDSNTVASNKDKAGRARNRRAVVGMLRRYR